MSILSFKSFLLVSCFYKLPIYSTCDDEKDKNELSDKQDVCNQVVNLP